MEELICTFDEDGFIGGVTLDPIGNLGTNTVFLLLSGPSTWGLALLGVVFSISDCGIVFAIAEAYLSVLSRSALESLGASLEVYMISINSLSQAPKN